MKIGFFTILLMFSIWFHSFSKETRKPEISKLDQYNLTDLISDKEGNLFLGTEYGGIFRSTDNGNSWFLTNSITKNYLITSLNYNDYEGLFASTMNWSLLQSTDKGKSWLVRYGNPKCSFDIMDCMITTKKRYKVLSGYYTLDNYNKTGWIYFHLNSLYFSKDGSLYACGSNSTGSKDRRNDNVDSLKSPWIDINNAYNLKTFCFVEDDKSRIYEGTEKGIYYSDDKGQKWNLLSIDLVNYSISSLFYTTDKLLIAGTDSNGIFISIDKGITWNSIKNLGIDSRVNKIVEGNNNLLLSITKKNGIFCSKDKGYNWEKMEYQLYDSADSLVSKGWMPSINFYDLFLNSNIERIDYLKFINNDSILVINGNNNRSYKLINIPTGLTLVDFQFPDSMDILYFNPINIDSVVICYKTNKYFIGYYSLRTNKFSKLFELEESYFIKQLHSPYLLLSKVFFNSINLDANNKNECLLKYVICGYCNEAMGTFYNYINKFELRDFATDSVLKFFDYNTIYSRDKNYYLDTNFRKYDFNGKLIYDMKTVFENQNYFLNSYIKSFLISDDATIIVLNDVANKVFLIANFENGEILRKIKNDNYSPIKYTISSDNNFLFTASNDSKIQVYNIKNSNGPFDEIIFNSGESNWVLDKAKFTNTIVFGGTDCVLRLWKPNYSLTEAEEKPLKDNNIVSIYPNPAGDFIYLNKGLQALVSGEQIKIYNIYGECVITMETGLRPVSTKIDVSGLPAGVYFVRCGSQYAKFMKK